MADSVHPADIDSFIDNAVWAIRSTYHTVLKASPGAAIFGRDMLFNIPFVADWNKIGDYRQRQTDRSNTRENSKRVDYDYKVGDKVLIRKDSILRKAESIEIYLLLSTNLRYIIVKFYPYTLNGTFPSCR